MQVVPADAATVGEHVTPARGLLFVRPVETDETLPGGRILLTQETRDAMVAHQCEVIAVGDFAECDPSRSREERKCERKHDYECIAVDCGGFCTDDGRRVHGHNIRVGDWLVVRPRSFIQGPSAERKEWFIHQDAVLAVLHIEDEA